MDLPEQLAAVWARRLVVLGAAVLCAALVFVLRSDATASYEATATVRAAVGPSSGDPTTEADYYAQTAIGLATSRGVVTAAVQGAGSSADVDSVLADLTVDAGSESGFVEITAPGASPEQAAELANSVVTALQQRFDQDQQRTAPRLELVEAADPPSDPASPRPARDALLGFILAGIVTAEAVVVRRAWRGALSERHPGTDVSRITGVPAVLVDPSTRAGPALAAVLPLVRHEPVVTVVERGRRPTADTASRLAGLLAAAGEDVVVVDASVDRPMLHVRLGVAARPGFADVLADRAELAQCLVAVPGLDHVRVLPAGAGSHAVPDRGCLSKVLAELRQWHVVVCVSDSRLEGMVAVVAECGEAVVLDVDARTVTKHELTSDVEVLRGLGAHLVAAVVHRGARRVPGWLRVRHGGAKPMAGGGGHHRVRPTGR